MSSRRGRASLSAAGSIPYGATDPALSPSIYMEDSPKVSVEIEQEKMRKRIEKWIGDINSSVKDVQDYVHGLTRESHFMIDEFDSAFATSIELKPSSREPVVYTTILVAMLGGAGVGTILVGRRRITFNTNVSQLTTIQCAMRVYENDRRILLNGTPEAPDVAVQMYFEMTGRMFPHQGP